MGEEVDGTAHDVDDASDAHDADGDGDATNADANNADAPSASTPSPAPPPLTGAVLPDGRYAWNDAWRDDRGHACGDSDTFRWGFADATTTPSHPGLLTRFVAALGFTTLDAAALEHPEGAIRWRRVQGAWLVETRLSDGARVAQALHRAQRRVLASALDTLLPIWQQAHDEERAEERERDRLEAERIEQGAAAAGVSVATYKAAETTTRALQRMARTKDRDDPDYFARCVPIVAHLLDQDVHAGLDEGCVVANHRLGVAGETLLAWKWLPAVGDGPERLGLVIGPGAGDVGDWKRTMPGAIDVEERVAGRAMTLTAFDGRFTLRVSRQLERRSLAAALALRIALCLDSVVERRRDLTMLSQASVLADIADPEIRERARAIGRQVPLPQGLHLREYQTIGVAYAAASGFRCLIGDSPGVGKTAQAIGAMLYAHGQVLPALVVCPASVLYNWEREIRRFAPWLDPVVIAKADTELPEANERRVYIVSWDLLSRLAEDLLFEGIQLIIMDECHFSKNAQAQRSQAAKRIAHQVPYAMGLSGTAMENHVGELWHILHILQPEEYPTREDFNHRFKNLRQRVVERRGKRGRTELRTFADDTSGDLNAELRWRLRYTMVRRRKQDVLTELPPKVRTPLWVTLPDNVMSTYRKVEERVGDYLLGVAQRAALADAVHRFHAGIEEGLLPQRAAVHAVRAANANANVPSSDQAKMFPLWRFVGEAKVPLALQWIAERRASVDEHEEPLILFVWHQQVLKGLAKGLESLGVRWTYVDGSINGKKRDERVHAFQQGAYDYIIGTKALYQGVNLFRAADVLFVEQWLVPAWIEQAEDRAHRSGQTRTVNAYHLCANGTVDEDIAANNARKWEEAGAVLGAEDVTDGEVSGDARRALVASSVGSDAALSLAARLAATAEGGAGVKLGPDGRPLYVTPAMLAKALRAPGAPGGR